MFMRVASFLLSRDPTVQEVKETDAVVDGSEWPGKQTTKSTCGFIYAAKPPTEASQRPHRHQ
jgi:hypothetical protein